MNQLNSDIHIFALKISTLCKPAQQRLAKSKIESNVSLHEELSSNYLCSYRFLPRFVKTKAELSQFVCVVGNVANE